MADFDFSTLVTDRSPADLELLRDLLSTPMEDWTAEQLAEFNLAASKGAYNYTDLNRVTACMDYLNEVLTGLGYETGYQRIVVHPGEPPGPVGPLPEGYTELEYIEGAGTQFLDAGIPANENISVELEFSLLATPGGETAILGAQWSNSGYFLSYVPGNAIRFHNGGWVDMPLGSITQRNMVTLTNNSIQLNGESKTFSATATYPTTNIYLFATGDGAAGSWIGKFKLYSCKIFNAGVLIREFIPCINPSGNVGLFDVVNNQFHGNIGGGVFIPGIEVVSLPDGYTQLEYIEASGGQYINTGIIPDADTVVIADFQTTAKQSTNNDVFGVIGQFSFRQYIGSDFFRTVSGSAADFSTSVSILARHTVYKSMLNTTIDGQYTVKTTLATVTYPLYLFAYNAGTYISNYGYQRIFSCAIFDGATATRLLIPAKNAGGIAGLYDLRTGTFYQNQGSGAFVAGGEVVPPTPGPDPEPERDKYEWFEDDVPTTGLLNAYLANVAALRNVIALPEDTPEVPADMVGLTQTEANNIEGILEIIYQHLTALQAVFLRAGMGWAVSGGPGYYFENGG